ncbi:MAG: ribonuclease III [Verrucomicrobiota bacterium]
MSDPLEQLQLRIGHTFRDRRLLETAVTHLSYIADHPETLESNQRMEFLGDAVLQILMAEALYDLFPTEREGPLSKRRALLVNGSFLALLAREIQLDTCLRLGASEESTGGRNRTSSLGDAFEAVVGAVYLDSDIDRARRVVLDLYGPLPDRLATVEDAENPKGRLQEFVQPRHGNHAVRYEVVSIAGEDHAREYEVAVYVMDRALGSGRGPSKKVAEEAAAHGVHLVGGEDA